MTNGAGDKFSLTEGDGLVVEVKISGMRRVSSGFFPAFEVGGIEIGWDAGAVGDFFPSADFPDESGGGSVGIFT